MSSLKQILLFALLAFIGNIAQAAAARPNVVYIIADDQAWTDYGFMGHPVIQTPHLDRLSRRSAFFPRGYVPTALCRPSLATLITGLYAHQHLLTGNDPSTKEVLPNSPEYAELRARMIGRIDQLPTLPKLLGAQGYQSHQSGKWWEGPFQRGGFTYGMTRGFPQSGGRHGDDGLKIGRQGLEPVFDFVKQAAADKKPFFLWYAPFLPHSPHNPPERLLNRYQGKVESPSVAKYYAMCEWADENCGALLDFLDNEGLSENTLVVYIADNGWIQDPASEKFAPRSKLSPYEGGVRQPILLSWPGVIAPKKYETPVSSIDLAPTILTAAGAQVPEQLPGRNLLPAIRDGGPLAVRPLFGEGFSHDVFDLSQPEACLLYRWTIDGSWKLILTYDGEIGRDAEVHPRNEKRPQLFNLEADPHEAANVAADHPDLVAKLAQQIADWWPVQQRKTITRWNE